MEMTLQHTLSLECTKKYSSLSTENYSSLSHPPIVKQTGGSNLGCSARLPFGSYRSGILVINEFKGERECPKGSPLWQGC
jgi:hypothetical protein